MQCIDFFNSHFAGATSMDRVSIGKTLLSSYIRKILSKARKVQCDVTYVSSVNNVRSRNRPLEYFTNLPPLYFGKVDTASPASDPSQSSGATPSVESYGTGSTSAVSQKSEALAAALAKAHSALALHGISVDDPLIISSPAIPVSEPLSSVVIRPAGSSQGSVRLESGISSLPPTSTVAVISSASASLSSSPLLSYSHATPVSSAVVSVPISVSSFSVAPSQDSGTASFSGLVSSFDPSAPLSASSSSLPPSQVPPPPGFAPLPPLSLPVSIPLGFSGPRSAFLPPPPPPPPDSIPLPPSVPSSLPSSHPAAHFSYAVASHSHGVPISDSFSLPPSSIPPVASASSGPYFPPPYPPSSQFLPPPPPPPPPSGPPPHSAPASVSSALPVSPAPASVAPSTSSSSNASTIISLAKNMPTSELVNLLFNRVEEDAHHPSPPASSAPASGPPMGGSPVVAGGSGLSRGIGSSSSSIPPPIGLGVGGIGSTAAFAFSNQGQPINQGPDVHTNEDGVVAAEGEVEYEEVPDIWSSWTPLNSSHEILFDNEGGEQVKSALFIRGKNMVIPWNRVKTCIHGNVEYVSIKSSSNPCSIKSKTLSSKKTYCNPIFEKFPEYQVPISEQETQEWTTHFTYGSSFNDEGLSKSELPVLFKDIHSVFAAIASGVKHQSYPLKPSCVFFLESFREIGLGLPTGKFPSSVFAEEFNKGAEDIIKPGKELLDDEYKSRMEFLAATVSLSALHAFSIMFKASPSPSPLGAIFYSLFTGLRPFIDFTWSQAFIRFAHARAALRKAAFAKPYLEIANKLVLEDPFSQKLFSSKAMSTVSDLLKGQSLVFSDVLNLTAAAKSAHYN